jgi:hypothetical protein
VLASFTTEFVNDSWVWPLARIGLYESITVRLTLTPVAALAEMALSATILLLSTVMGPDPVMTIP